MPMPEIKKLDLNDPDTKSAEITADNLAVIRNIFPEAFKEGGIDFDVLKHLLGGAIDDRDEKYGLNWHGKRRARQIALTPSTGTLLPCLEESLAWNTTQNLIIEGDNLEVLKLFQKSYSNKIKMIYIDPPYNTGRDFVYEDNFSENMRNYLEITGQIESNRRIVSNADASGRFHTAWLNMIYPRIKLAHALLRDDGVMFISIGEGELANLIEVCRQIFGEENAIGIACRVAKKSNNKGDYWAPNFDYIISCSKNRDQATPFLGGINTAAYDQIESEGPRKGERYQLVRLYMSTIQNRNPDQRFWIDCPDGSKVIPPGSTFPPERPKLGDGIWRWSKRKFDEDRDRIVVKSVRSSNLVSDHGGPAKWNVFTKTYLNDVIDNATSKPNNLIEDYINQIGSHEMTKLGIPFDYPKPSGLIKHLCSISRTGGDDIILDFFAGSGTTADAVMQINADDGQKRRFVLVQLPEPFMDDDASQKEAIAFCDKNNLPRNLSELTKERVRRSAANTKASNGLFDSDYGFRAFKLAESNIRAWEPDTANLEDSLLKNSEHIVQGRTEADVLYELLLKLGLDLCVPIEKKEIAGKAVHAIGGGVLIVCLADGVTKDVVEPLSAGIVAWQKALAPAVDTRVVFRDSGFADDIAKTNMAAILNQNGITDVRSL